ncbi:MAG: EAL domain-containing protein [Treponema sp.]|nr:EAL domain-containing protein [Candidatus Treponema equifaecale]
MFRLIFIIFAALMVAVMCTCCFYLRRRDSQIKRSLYKLNFFAVFTTILYVLSILKFSYNTSVFISGAYYSSVHWLLLFFVDYLFLFTDTPLGAKTVRGFRYFARVLAILDTISLTTNVFNAHAFSLNEYFQDGKFYCWIPTYNVYFTVHLVLCYLLVGLIIYGLTKKLMTSTKFYRHKYALILAILIFIVIVDGLYLIFKHKLDISILTYGLFSVSASYFTFYSIPRAVESKLLSVISENLADGVLCFNSHGKCIFANITAKKYFPKELDAELELAQLLLQKKELILRDITITAGGKEYVLSEEFHSMKDTNSKSLGYFILIEDITREINELNEEKYRSTHDLLTGLYNRSCFFAEVEKIIKASPEVPRYLICSDIENFKLVNDLFGTNFGDEVLKKQAELLTKAKYPECIHGRISGDKFAMLIRKENFNADLAVQNTEKINVLTNDLNYKIKIKLGIYEISDPYESVVAMYDKANLALHSIKNDFECSLVYYHTSLLDHLIEEKNIVSAFKTALTENQFEMYLQPQISSDTEKAEGAEALVRWIHPEKGMISPASFVPILENAGYLYHLDKFIWERAAEKLARWKAQGIDMHIAVNISAKDFYHLDLYKTFTELVDRYGISPAKLKLEITETVFMHDIKLHTSILKRLQEYGFSIEMDDFGSGYSSLNMLNNISMDILKIDMVFLKKTQNVERSKKIITSIISMAKQLGMKVITEGVETVENVEFLKNAGCDYFQGYLFSKPISVKEFEQKFVFVGEEK